MADDDIKKDADLQRGKDPLENDAVESSEVDLLKSIKATLVSQTEMLEGDISSEISSVKNILTSILDVNKQQLENLSRTSESDTQEELDQNVDKLREQERDAELLQVFKDIRNSVGTSAENSDKGKSFKLTGLFGLGFLVSQLPKAALGIGGIFAGIGIGIGLGAAGLLLGAKAVEFTASQIGDLDTDAMIEAGNAISTIAKSLDLAAITALGTVFAGSVVLSVLPGGGFGIQRATGIAAGMAGIGLGIGGFFAGFMLGAKAVEGVDNLFEDINYDAMKKAAIGFGDVLDGFDLASMGVISTLLAIEIFKNSKFTGSKFTLRSSSSAVALFSVGAGISGFFLGLTLGNVLVGLTDAKLSSMVAASEGLVKIIKPLVDNPAILLGLGTLVAAGVFGTMSKKSSAKAVAKVTGGIALAGAAIGAFFTGLNVGAIGTYIGDGGANLNALMVNVAEGLSAFSGTQIKSMLAAGGIFGVVSAIPGGMAVAGLATVGIGLAGAALGAFFTGIGLNDALLGAIGADGSTLNKLMVNTARGLSSFNEIDGLNLISVGGGLAAIGAGLFGFATGKFIDASGRALVNFGESIVDLGKNAFAWLGIGEGAQDRKTVLEVLADDLRNFAGLGPDLDAAVSAVQNIPSMFGNLKPKDEEEVLRGIKFYAGAARLLLNEFDFEAKDRAFQNLADLNEVTKGLDFKASIELDGIDRVTEELNDLAELLEKITNQTGLTIQPMIAGATGQSPTQIVVSDSSSSSSSTRSQYFNINSSSGSDLTSGIPGS